MKFLVDMPISTRLTAYLKHLASTYTAEILSHSIIIVEDLRVRIRELPI